MERRAEGQRALLAAAILFAGAAAYGACSYDPVPQEIIDGLGEEDGEPSASHRPGQPCLACHTAYEGAEPELAVGGTLYTIGDEDKAVPAAGVLVTIFDSAGDSRKACSNPAGNFYIEKADWEDVSYPLAVVAGDRSMRSLIGRDGSCASCHFVSEEADHDPVTGAGRDSPGLVIVELGAGESCGSAP